MTVDVIKNFVEKYKDFTIQIRLDNEHLVYDNMGKNAPVIWDWDNENFMVIEPNDEAIDQGNYPMQIRLIDFGDIQELSVYVDRVTAMNFINEKITDEEKKTVAKELLQKVTPAMMTPSSLRRPHYDNELQITRVKLKEEDGE